MQLKTLLIGLLSASGALASSSDGTLDARAPNSNKPHGLGKGITLRIMPLGASITYGSGSSKGNGYRRFLREALIKGGNNVNMVGSRRSGDFQDSDTEGWPGATVDEVRTKAMAGVSVSKFKPNVVLINAGTNDAAQNKDLAKAGARMERLVTDVLAKSPRAVVVVSTLIMNRKDAIEKRVRVVNEQYKKAVAKLQKAGKRVILVDMHTAQGPQKNEMSDDTHPNDTGYRKMAAIWLNGIKEADRRGWLRRAENTPATNKKPSAPPKPATKQVKKSETAPCLGNGKKQ